MSKGPERFGKYTLLEKLASGGMAEIFLSRAPGAEGIRKFVAIKRILPQFSDSKEYKEMFTSEAKIAVNLSHSNVVSIHEFGIQNKQLFLIMEYVEGRNLRQILNKMKELSIRLSLDQVIYIIKEVAAGLDHAHRCIDDSTGQALNIIHRDMSPQNIMMSFEGEVKIVDFGIARIGTQAEMTPEGTLKGKFGYMSPEQTEGKSIDLKTDIFSLGIILWEFIANERLFLAKNEISTLKKIRKCEIPNLTRLNPNVSPDLERIVKKALAKDKNFRYQNAALLHRDLNRFLNKRFPDFSSQEFSGVIKKIYAKEIVESRKRIIEYAKIPTEKEESESNLINEHEDQFLDDTIMMNNHSSVTLTESPNIPLQTQTTSQNQSHTTDPKISESQITFVTKSGVRTKMLTHTNIDKLPQRSGMKYIAIAIVGLIGLFMYKTDTYQRVLPANWFHKLNILSSQKQQKNIASKSKKENKANLNPNTPPKNQGQRKNVNRLPIAISSNPSGAVIFINGQNTGQTTPSRLLVPQGLKLDISLQKEGYITHKNNGVVIQSAGQTLQHDLKRASLAYLDIDARPPDPSVKIYIDGKLLRKPLPIRRYNVPAKALIVEAKNTSNNTYAKKRILLQKGQRRSIIFKLKPRPKRQRTPAKKK